MSEYDKPESEFDKLLAQASSIVDNDPRFINHLMHCMEVGVIGSIRKAVGLHSPVRNIDETDYEHHLRQYVYFKLRLRNLRRLIDQEGYFHVSSNDHDRLQIVKDLAAEQRKLAKNSLKEL
jgi:hypothetical protein